MWCVFGVSQSHGFQIQSNREEGEKLHNFIFDIRAISMRWFVFSCIYLWYYTQQKGENIIFPDMELTRTHLSYIKMYPCVVHILSLILRAIFIFRRLLSLSEKILSEICQLFVLSPFLSCLFRSCYSTMVYHLFTLPAYRSRHNRSFSSSHLLPLWNIISIKHAKLQPAWGGWDEFSPL